MKTGVLITNLGTPSSPRVKAVRQYLAEFLSDRRVVDLSPLLWLPILYGVILNTRPRQSAKLYQKIWTKEGSPLLVYSEALVKALNESLPNFTFALAMRYGQPSIEQGLEALKAQGVNKIIVLPLYPQYSATTTATTFDKLAEVLKKWRIVPSLHFINQYGDQPAYIKAIADSIKSHWEAKGRAQKLIFSFHGLPKDYVEKGDPYQTQCEASARAIADCLKLNHDEWMIVYQSRLGPKEWLKPYASVMMAKLPAQGIKTIEVVCPGFAVDCLETVEEIAMQNKVIFLNAGGTAFHYIPALNASQDHVELLKQIILSV